MSKAQDETRWSLGLLKGPDGLRLLLDLWDEFPEHMFIIRVEGPDDFILEAINPAHQASFGAESDIAGKRIKDILPEPVGRAVVARYKKCLSLAKPLRYEESGSYINPEGEEVSGRWLTLLVPLADDNGEIHHLFGVSKDITEVYQARRRLEEQNRLLEQRVAERTEALARANEELRQLAARDFLTDCYNRRQLAEIAEKEIHRARRYHLPFSLALIDVDRFKQINDQQGHNAGDRILKGLARTLQATVRSADILGRYGGDEFLVLMPDTDLAGAAQIADRLKSAVRERCGQSISIGTGELTPADTHLEQLVERADHSLMQAKARNQGRASGNGSVERDMPTT